MFIHHEIELNKTRKAFILIELFRRINLRRVHSPTHKTHGESGWGIRTLSQLEHDF